MPIWNHKPKCGCLGCNQAGVRHRHRAGCACRSCVGVPIRERFWAKVVCGGPSECWEWTATLDGGGYGRIKSGGKLDGAHRVSWELHHGKIPVDRWVLHRCDNRKCVNPAHLFLGTRGDNVSDMVQKGRAKNPAADRRRARTACAHGHPYTLENTARTKTGARRCRACDREAHRVSAEARLA